MLCTAGLYEFVYEFEGKGPCGRRGIECDGIEVKTIESEAEGTERQRIEGPSTEGKIREVPYTSWAASNVNLSVVHGGRGREEYAAIC